MKDRALRGTLGHLQSVIAFCIIEFSAFVTTIFQFYHLYKTVIVCVCVCAPICNQTGIIQPHLVVLMESVASNIQ